MNAMPPRIKTPLQYKKKKEKREKESEYMKEEMTKGCKQPASRVTHADPILLLRPYKYGTNGL